MNDGHLVLSDEYTIKGSTSEKILFNLKDGTRYLLEPNQFEFLCLCDGTMKLAEILKEYDEDSQKTIIDFIDTLMEINAICAVQEKRRRKINNSPVPDIRLQAVQLEATSKCNMNCAHCYQGNRYPVLNNLSISEIRRLIEEMERMQVENVSISGGEPFVDEKTFEIMHCIEQHDMRVSAIFTNGYQISEELIKKLLLTFRGNPTFFVSLDAITPQAMEFRGFNETTGKKVLETIMENIEMLAAHGIKTVINTVMNKYNLESLLEMYNFMRNVRINSWRIGFPKRTGFFKDRRDLELPWEVMAEASFKLLQHHLEENEPFHLQIEYLYRNELFENFQPLSDDDFVCDYEGRLESCCIKPNGDVVSCAYCTDFPIGNIRGASLEKIWYSPSMQKVKKIRIRDVKECRDCELRFYCATGCRINAYFLGGDFYHAKDGFACNSVNFFMNKVIPLLIAKGIVKQ